MFLGSGQLLGVIAVHEPEGSSASPARESTLDSDGFKTETDANTCSQADDVPSTV